MSDISSDVALRITTADTRAATAVSAAQDIAEALSDLEDIRLPVIFGSPISAPAQAPLELNDNPEIPDGDRMQASRAALDEVSAHLENIDELNAQVDDELALFDATISAVERELPIIKGLISTIVTPQPGDFNFTEVDFLANNALNDALKSIITEEIRNGGSGYASATETAMYELEKERRELARQEAIDEALANFAGAGFSKPQGHHIEAIRKINEQFRMDDDKRSSDVMQVQTKLALENKWKALNGGISYNQMMFAYFDAKAQRALEAALSTLSLGIAVIKFNVDMVMQALDVSKAGNDAVLERVQILIERYNVALARYRKRVETLEVKAQGYIKQYQSSGGTYGIEVETAADVSRLNQADHKISLEMQKVLIARFMAEAENNLKSFLATAGINLGSVTDGAEIQKEIAVATIDGLGTIVNRIKTGESLATDADTA